MQSNHKIDFSKQYKKTRDFLCYPCYNFDKKNYDWVAGNSFVFYFFIVYKHQWELRGCKTRQFILVTMRVSNMICTSTTAKKKGKYYVWG